MCKKFWSDWIGRESERPPFKELLTGGIGYIATTGETVYYGREETTPEFLKRVEPEIQRRIFGKAAEPYEAVPFLSRPQDRAPGKWHACLACGITGKLTRHHLIPRQFKPQGKRRGTVWLCFHCHSAIHRYKSNHEISLMPEA